MAKADIKGKIVLEIDDQRITIGEMDVSLDEPPLKEADPDFVAVASETYAAWIGCLGQQARIAVEGHLGPVSIRYLLVMFARRMGIDVDE